MTNEGHIAASWTKGRLRHWKSESGQAAFHQPLARNARSLGVGSQSTPIRRLFDRPNGPHRPGRDGSSPSAPKRVVFAPVPICVVVEDALVSDIVVIDETDVANCSLVEGDPADLPASITSVTNGQAWPSWRFSW